MLKLYKPINISSIRQFVTTYKLVSYTVHTSSITNSMTQSISTSFKHINTDISVYQPYKLQDTTDDWVSELSLTVTPPDNINNTNFNNKPKVLVLYGSLRKTSYNRLLAYEFSRILYRLGCDVRVFDPRDLPHKDDNEATIQHRKVCELRELSMWSDGHLWVCPEQHGSMSGIFKNQIDWIPLELGSVRPTQGKVLAVAQANGGSQSFNVVNSLRLLGRWMRMFTIPNQSSVPKAWTEFDSNGRMKPSSYRNRVVDVAEEFYKFLLLMPQYSDWLVDRYSEREERKEKGRLLSQAEKEAADKTNTQVKQLHNAHTNNST